MAKSSLLKFVLPARDPKADLVSIVLGDQKLVVGRLKVKLGEEHGATTLVDELVDVLQWLARLAGQLLSPQKSWQKRHDPSNLRAKTTNAA